MAVFGCGAHFHAEEDAPGEFVEPAEAAKWVDEASCIAVDPGLHLEALTFPFHPVLTEQLAVLIAVRMCARA